ncbi:hypothetical protein ACIOGZ_41325 [Kitasatospora sp. NPDC088160]|uniref:hypothetical protein n=1 Tax=Kitasatospora sp. NPDC088160 TaxID=3364072 RepID=UPI00381E1E3F
MGASAYRAFRPGLPEDAATLLTDTVCGTPHPMLLDLGTGTGQVPAAVHGAFTRIDIVEPDQGMIDEAIAVLRALAEFSPESTFDELVRTEAIIATRPS